MKTLKALAAKTAVTLAMIAGAALWSSHAVAVEQWRAYTYNASSVSPQGQSIIALIERLNKELKDEVTFKLHLNGTLMISATDLTRAVSGNVVQFSDDPFYVGSIPAGGVVRLPMLVRSDSEFDAAGAIAAPYVAEKFKKLGVVVLGRMQSPANSIWSRKKLTTLEDLKGLKVRVISPEQAEFLKALGAIPVTLGTSEVAAALDRGVVDAATTAASGYGYVWRELFKYNYQLPFYVDILYIANEASWNNLSPATRQKIQKIVSEAGPQITAKLLEEEQKLMAKVKAEGIIVTVPSAAELASATEKISPYWATWTKSRGPEAAEMLQKIKVKLGR